MLDSSVGCSVSKRTSKTYLLQTGIILITTKPLFTFVGDVQPFTITTTINKTIINKGMLTPIAYTNHRLNSSIVNRDHTCNNSSQRKKLAHRKRVTFSKEGIPPSHPAIRAFSLSLPNDLYHHVRLFKRSPHPDPLIYDYCEYAKFSDGEGEKAEGGGSDEG
jgi:hypothetical protein